MLEYVEANYAEWISCIDGRQQTRRTTHQLVKTEEKMERAKKKIEVKSI